MYFRRQNWPFSFSGQGEYKFSPTEFFVLFVSKERTLKLLWTEMMISSISKFVYQLTWRLFLFEKTSSELIDSFFAFRFLPNTVFFCIQTKHFMHFQAGLWSGSSST